MTFLLIIGAAVTVVVLGAVGLILWVGIGAKRAMERNDNR